jgi:prepilin-type N-terminal cleavage/methylation domain-containing protein
MGQWSIQLFRKFQTMRILSRSKSQKGYSMIELLIVLAIIAALIAGAFYLYPRVQAARAANAEATILQSFQANMKSLFTTGEYSKATIAVTAAAGMWPNSMLVGGPPPVSATNEWGGAVTVNGATAAGAACAAAPCQYFVVSYPTVPSDVCQKLLPSLSASYDLVKVGATVIQDLDNVAAAVQYDPSKVPTACGATSGGTPVTLTLVSR